MEYSSPPPPPPPPPAPALSPPPPSFPLPPPAPARQPRPGELTAGWRTITMVAWIGVLLGLGTVWYTSRTLGLSTWWLGPETRPRLILVSLVPFVLPLAVAVAAARRLRLLPLGGLLAAASTAAVGAGDIDRVPGLAAVEIALGIGGALVALASLSGTYRRA